MAAHDLISGPDVHYPLPIQVQPCDRRPSGSCHADDGEPIRRPDKVLIPGVSAWVKQRNLYTRFGVFTSHPVGFSAVAVKTGKSEIFGGLRAASGERDDMIYGKSDVLPLL
jgi:hypothetical protein